MKKILFPIIALSLASCAGNSNDLEGLKKQKGDVQKEITALKGELEELNKQIEDKDTTKAVYPLVTIAEAEEMEFAEKVKFQATVEADKNVMVSPQASGAIKGIFVKEGQRVAAGKTLASLDSDILNRNVAELEKSIELATYMFEKQQKLKDQGVGVEIQYEQAKNQKESLERKLATLSTQASKSRVVSPISGYVDEVFPKIGEMASPQMPMFRVLNLDRVTIKSEISEDYLRDIKTGSPVTVTFPSLGIVKEQSITRTGKFINPANRTFEVQVDLKNTKGDILPNLLAELEVTKQFSKDALVIPSRSILEDSEGNKYVYLLANGKAKKTAVKVDFVQGDLTQLKKENGIAKGDKVIVRGVEAIVDGEKVTVKK